MNQTEWQSIHCPNCSHTWEQEKAEGNKIYMTGEKIQCVCCGGWFGCLNTNTIWFDNADKALNEEMEQLF